MPKGGASSLTPVYAGLQEDLDGFLRAFLSLKSLRYSDYKDLFQAHDMGQLFNGRSSSAEIIEFNDYILMYCLPYMDELVCPQSPRTFAERIFGLYSLYTFFYLQEIDHVVKIRIDPDAARNFRQLMELAHTEKIYEAYMAGLKLLQDSAFKYVAFIQVYDPSCFKRFYTDKKVSGVTLRTNLNDPLSAVREMVDSPLFASLSVVHKEYLRMKKSTGMEMNTMPELRDLRSEAKKVIIQRESEAEVVTGVEVIINTDYTIEHLGTRGMLRSEIKEKAYGSDLHLSRFRRHCTTSPVEIETDTFEYEVKAEAVEHTSTDVKEEVPPDAAKKNRKKPKKRGRKRLNPSPPPPPPLKTSRKVKMENNTEISEDLASWSAGLLDAKKERSSRAKTPKTESIPSRKSRRIVGRSPEKIEDSDLMLKILPKEEIDIAEFYEQVPINNEVNNSKEMKPNDKRRVRFMENRKGEIKNTVHIIPCIKNSPSSSDELPVCEIEMLAETSSRIDEKSDQLSVLNQMTEESNSDSESENEMMIVDDD